MMNLSGLRHWAIALAVACLSASAAGAATLLPGQALDFRIDTSGGVSDKADLQIALVGLGKAGLAQLEIQTGQKKPEFDLAFGLGTTFGGSDILSISLRISAAEKDSVEEIVKDLFNARAVPSEVFVRVTSGALPVTFSTLFLGEKRNGDGALTALPSAAPPPPALPPVAVVPLPAGGALLLAGLGGFLLLGRRRSG